MKNPRDIIIEPVVSEKSYDLAADKNTYTFVFIPGRTRQRSSRPSRRSSRSR